MELKIRSQEEIVERIRNIELIGADPFGFRIEALAPALTWDNAKEFLNPDTEPHEWYDDVSAQDVLDQGREYYLFALRKMIDHRGISALRSTEKLIEYAWLLCRDDVVDLMTDAPYSNYGAPKVKIFAEGLGFDWPADNADLVNMAAGEPCTDECQEGCDR